MGEGNNKIIIDSFNFFSIFHARSSEAIFVFNQPYLVNSVNIFTSTIY